MSRWSIPELASMTEQQVFDTSAYHMLLHGGCPRDLFLKPESRPFNKHRTWAYLRRQRRVPAHAAHLIDDLERIHRERNPAEWMHALSQIARVYNLKGPTP